MEGGTVLFYGGWDGLILWRVGRSYAMEGRTVLFHGGWDGLILSRVGRSYLRVVFAYKWSNIT